MLTPMAPTSMSIRRPKPGRLTAASASAEVPSFEHLIRPRQQRGRDGEAEGLGRFKVDDELERGRLFDWEVGGLRTLEDLIHVAGRAPVYLDAACTIGQQITGLGVPRQPGHHRQTAL